MAGLNGSKFELGRHLGVYTYWKLRETGNSILHSDADQYELSFTIQHFWIEKSEEDRIRTSYHLSTAIAISKQFLLKKK